MGGHFPNVGRQILTLELMFQVQNNMLSFDGQRYYVFWRQIGTRMHITIWNSNKGISCQHVKDVVVLKVLNVILESLLFRFKWYNEKVGNIS